MPSLRSYHVFMKINWQVAGTVSLPSCSIVCGYFDLGDSSWYQYCLELPLLLDRVRDNKCTSDRNLGKIYTSQKFRIL